MGNEMAGFDPVELSGPERLPYNPHLSAQEMRYYKAPY